MPELPEETFVQAIELLVAQDKDWVSANRTTACICDRLRQPQRWAITGVAATALNCSA